MAYADEQDPITALASAAARDVAWRGEPDLGRTDTAARVQELLFQSIEESVIILDADGRAALVNRAAGDTLGYAEGELIGRDFHDTLHLRVKDGRPEPRELCPVLKTLRTGIPTRGDAMILTCKDGRTLQFELTASPLTAGGTTLGCVVILRDVTARKQAEAALRASEARFRSLADGTFEAVAIHQRGRIQLVNRTFEETFRCSASDACGRSVLEFAAPEDVATVRAAIEAGRTEPYLATGVRADGTRFIGELQSRPVTYMGRPARLTAIRDVTERTEWERRLGEQARILDLANDAIILRDLDDRITYWNHGAERMYGWSREEAIGQVVHDLLRTGFPTTRENVLQAFIEEAAWEGELVHHRKDQRRIHVASRWTLERDARGDPVKVLEINNDVTARRLVEDQLRLRHRAVEAASNGLVIAGPNEADNPILYANPAFERMIGYPKEEYLGKSFLFLQGPETDQAAVRRLSEALRAGTEAREVLLNYRKDERPFWNEMYLSPIREPDGRISHWMGVVTDVTSHVEGKAALRELNETLATRIAEKTAELRRTNADLEAFTHSASHDLRAPLRAIDYFAEMLAERETCLDEDGQNAVRRLRAESTHLSQLLNDLLDLSRARSSEVRVEPVDLSELARSVVDGLHRTDPARVADVEIQPGLVACGDRSLLKVLLENLLGNAWKYTRPVEQARISVGRQDVDGAPAFFVRDNGVGFDPAAAHRLFVPFQRLHATTEFEGTGIGLATVARVVRRHGGRAWAEGTRGKGATFWFTLPSP